MTEPGKPKQYDLEDRTLAFARDIRNFVRNLPHTMANVQDARQLIRSSGSVGANYLEANQAVSRKDFVLRIKISRKEARESVYWLNLLDTGGRSACDSERRELMQEAQELEKIFGAILRKVQ